MLESVVDIDLPCKVIELIQQVKDFQAAHEFKRRNTDWFSLCSSIDSLVSWNNRAFSDDKFSNIEFAALAARAYAGLFEVSKQGLPYCPPSSVIAASSLATKLISTLPHKSLLPKNAKEFIFSQGLKDVAQMRPSDIPSSASGRGNPIVRWLINNIAEEFCYSFDCEPTVSIVGDLVRLGWPISDRSIRNTFTDELALQALETARTKRDNDNKSKIIAHQVISALPSTSKGITVNQSTVEPTATAGISDALILELRKLLSNESNILRVISILKAMQYEEQDYLEDEGN